MKKHFNLLYVLPACFLFIHCHKDVKLNASEHINFDSLSVGQTSSYAHFTSRMPWSDSDTAYKASSDSLILTIVDKDENGFKVSEQWLHNKKAPAIYYFKIDGDSLFVKPMINEVETRSEVFASQRSSFLLSDKNLPLLTTTRWAVLKDLGAIKAFGKVENVRILDKTYNNAIANYDAVQIIFDGPAITKIYSKADGFLSFQTIGSFRPNGNNYYLIP